MSAEYVFVDRYTATGRTHNGCDRCDGMGCYPLRSRDIRSPAEKAAYDASMPLPRLNVPLWLRIKRALGLARPFKFEIEEWRMITCPECGDK